MNRTTKREQKHHAATDSVGRDSLPRNRSLRLRSRRAGPLALFFVTLLAFPLSVRSEVLFSDGFGDADLDNNGTPLEANDVDIDRSFDDEPPVIITSYEPPEFPGVMVNEVDAALDASDTGLRWLFSRGWTSDFLSKANIKIMDDSAGAFPDSSHPSYPVPSLDSGYAMAFESTGRGSSATAFFGERVTLGPEPGDQVKVSFDFRVWLSAPNQNDFTPPGGASLRFGLFQDTDNQIGMENPFAGVPSPAFPFGSPAIWGEEGGHFRGDVGTVGAVEDRGWYTITDLGRTDFSDPVDFDGFDARINEETNESSSGGKFLEGSDNDFVARPNSADPDFLALDVTKAYHLAFTLERATDITPGDTIKGIYTVTERASGQTWSFEGTEPLFGNDGMPDGISSDSWDYFGIRNTTSISDAGNDDFDFILDNFKLEIFGSTASDVDGDFNDDGFWDSADIDALSAEILAETNDPAFDMNGDGEVTPADITDEGMGWLTVGGANNMTQTGGNPFLNGDSDLSGGVDVSDFNAWNSSKFTDNTAWSEGNFNAEGGVDVSDFNIWNGNKFGSSNMSAVPEPAAVGLLLIGGLFLTVRRTSTIRRR